MFAPLALLALLLELIAGYPKPVMKAIGHPVTWMGRLITYLDTRFNDPAKDPETRRRSGAIALFILVLVVGAAAFALETLLFLLPGIGLFLVGIACSTLIAQRSLHRHVSNVAEALEGGDLDKARQEVAHIVGRDTSSLDEAGVARAAIESLAENFADGVVSPVFWICLGGLTGGAFYKAINTADSMIGHRTEKYESFGRPAAQLDDLVNLPGARLSGLLLIGAAALGRNASAQSAWRTMFRDASKHASPNAGYPEAAMAGALGLSLGGPRTYEGTKSEGAWLGEGRQEANAADIDAALELYGRADGLLIALVVVLVGLIWIV